MQCPADAQCLNGLAQCCRQSLHTSFIAELQTIFSAIHHKSQLIPLAASSDSQSYNETLAAISQQQDATRSELSSLASDLAAAQSERANKMAYDSIAAQINALPSRSASLENIDRLEREMEELQQQSEVFKGTWSRRKDAFGKIVGQLEELGEEVREEKGEQERRQVMFLTSDGHFDEDPNIRITLKAMDEDEADDQPTRVHTAEGTPRPDDQEDGDGEEETGESGKDASSNNNNQLNPEAASFRPGQDDGGEGQPPSAQAPQPSEQNSSGGDKRAAQDQEQSHGDQDMEDGEMADS